MAPPTDSRLWPFVPWCCNEKTSNALKCQKLKKCLKIWFMQFKVLNQFYLVLKTKNNKECGMTFWKKTKDVVFHTRNPILCQRLNQTTAYLFSEKYCTFSWISIISWFQWIQMSIMFEGSVRELFFVELANFHDLMRYNYSKEEACVNRGNL